MKEYVDRAGEWRSLHFLQSNGLAIEYMKEIRHWMEVHPHEIIVLWISKHGSECAKGEEQYPNVTSAEKQDFFSEIVHLFEGLVVDFTQTSINETSVGEMLDRGHRLVMYASDYDEFTGGVDSELGRYALDGCLIDNELGPGITDLTSSQSWELDSFAKAEERKTSDKVNQAFYLMSMAIGVPTVQVTVAARERWGPAFVMSDSNISMKLDASSERGIRRCVNALSNPPGMSTCPQSLLDISQLDNYYRQRSLETAYRKIEEGYGYPHAIYLNGMWEEGTIRTGTKVLWGSERTEGSSDSGLAHSTAGYAYAASFVAYNIRKACHSQDEGQCKAAIKPYEELRAKYPMQQWEDIAYGRHVHWPN